MSYSRVDIAIKPSVEVQNYTIQLSQNISNQTETYFVLDNKNLFPHATIYSTEYPSTNLEKILEKLEEITKEFLPLLVKFETLSAYQGYIDFQLQKSKEWRNIHEQIIAALNSFRENHLRDKYTNPNELIQYSQEQQSYIKQYGYAEVFNTFRPHITITRARDEEKAGEIIKDLLITPFTFAANVIAAYTMGDHGTCTGILKEFAL